MVRGVSCLESRGSMKGERYWEVRVSDDPVRPTGMWLIEGWE